MLKSRCWLILLTLFLAFTTQCQASTSLRGNHAVEQIIPIVDSKPQEGLEAQTLSSEMKRVEERKKIDKLSEENTDEEKRKLGGEQVMRLFSTPIAQWTLGQWALLFVLIWLAGYALKCCPCITDILACFCCYELFCANDPGGFIAC